MAPPPLMSVWSSASRSMGPAGPRPVTRCMAVALPAPTWRGNGGSPPAPSGGRAGRRGGAKGTGGSTRRRNRRPPRAAPPDRSVSRSASAEGARAEVVRLVPPSDVGRLPERELRGPPHLLQPPPADGQEPRRARQHAERPEVR